MYYDKEYVEGLKKLHKDHVKAVEGMWLRNLCLAALSAASFGLALGCAIANV